MTPKDFVSNVYFIARMSDELHPMTFAEAVTTLQDWRLDGVEVPDDLRPLQLAAWWNELCGADGAELSFDCPTSDWLVAIDDLEKVLWEE